MVNNFYKKRNINKDVMLDFIVNPVAGDVSGKKMQKNVAEIEKILKEKGIDYSIHFTKEKGHAKTLTRELIENNATDIIAVGGDGTLHEVINGFARFDNVNLGLLPCGTGNDFASAINLPLNVEDALSVILSSSPKYTDFMQMPTVRAMNIIGMGIDVDVLKRYNALKKKTKFGYTKCLIKTLLKFNYVEFDAEINGERSSHKSFIACIANGNAYGGGIPICPIADPTDKKIDFVTIKEIKKLKIIGAFIKLKKGKILTLKESSHKTVKEVKIFPKTEYTVNVDGELYDNIPFEIKVVSNTLKMYRP